MSDRKSLVRQRAVLKGRITSTRNKLDENDSVSVSTTSELVRDYLSKIKILDENISDSFFEDSEDEELSSEHVIELASQSDYAYKITEMLNKLELISRSNEEKPKAEVSNCDLKLPKLECGVFTGEGKTSLEYFNFISSFNNIVGLRKNISGATKLTYLKSYVKGYAAKVIQHLQVADENYSVAIDLLEQEFLNQDKLTGELFDKFLNLNPRYDPQFHESKIFINEVRCVLSDLKIYGTDLLENEASMKFISHIVLSKLPKVFCQELARKIGTNYPSIRELFDNYVDVISTLNMRSGGYSGGVVHKPKPNVVFNKKFPSAINANTFTDKRVCKFCGGISHSMFKCLKYDDHASRVDRCVELKICSLCSSSKHEKASCPKTLEYQCKICNSKQHIAALCPKFAKSNASIINTSLHNSCSTVDILLPTITVNLSRSNKVVQVRCLIDTGASRSHIAPTVAKKLLRDNESLSFETKLNVSTYLGDASRSVFELSLQVDFGDKYGKLVVPFIADKDFHLSYKVDGLGKIIENLKSCYELADLAFYDAATEVVICEAILGSDVIQHFDQFNLISCLNGRAFDLGGKIIPLGNPDHFLSDEQITEKYERISGAFDVHTYTALNCESTSLEGLDAFTEYMPDLSKLFDIESLGIKDTDNDISGFDEKLIKSFREGVTRKDNRY